MTFISAYEMVMKCIGTFGKNGFVLAYTAVSVLKYIALSVLTYTVLSVLTYTALSISMMRLLQHTT